MKTIRSLMVVAVMLVLAAAVLAGCSGNSGNVANAPGTAPSGNQGGSGTHAGNDGTVKDSADTPNGDTGTNADTNTQTNTGSNSNTGAGTNSGAAAGSTAEGGQPKIVSSNEAFRVYEPAPDAVVGKSFTVKGDARVFEAAFSYSLEDGHNVLAEGHVTAGKGAPEWGAFAFTVTLTEMPTSPTGVLTIYESSAKDGSPVHELHIAYTFEKSLLKLEEQ